MNRRNVKIMRRKAGGTAGKNAEKYSLNLPAVWLHAMGLSKEDRVELSFDGEKITVRPLASTDPELFRFLLKERIETVLMEQQKKLFEK